MQPLLRLGTIGLILLASFAVPAARADQPLDEPAPFGVIQFSPDEAWIDLPYALGDAWSATLAVLTELKYDVKLDAAYVATNGQLRVADLWVAVEPHGSRDKSFTRIRIALDRHEDEYTQVRAEVILDAVATRLAPPAPAPAPAAQPQYAEQPVDPGVQDVYTGQPISTDSYAYSTPGTTVYNTYNTYNTYGYASYPTPYYANYGYYSPFCNYFPYWNCWSNHYGCGGWYGGQWCSPYFNSWACGPTYTYWNCPTWGFGFGFGCNPWWTFGFSGGWGNFCSSVGYPWNPWGNCGGSLVVINTNGGDDDSGGGSGGGGTDGKPGKGVIGINPKAGGLHASGSAKPVKNGKPGIGTSGTGVPVGGTSSQGGSTGTSLDGTPLVDAGDGRAIGGDPAAEPGPRQRDPGVDRSPRSGGIPRIQVTHRERNDTGTRFDPRTTVTRTVDTHTVDTRRASGDGSDTPRSAPSSSLPRVTETSSSTAHGKAPAGKVVRMSGPSYTPGFKGVVPGSSRPVSTVDGTTAPGAGPYGTSTGGSGNPYAGTPAPVVNRPTSTPASAPVFNSPGTSTTTYRPSAPSPGAPSGNPAQRSSGPAFAPPPVAAPRVSAPAPMPVSRPPAVSAPAPSAPAPSLGGGSGRGGGSAGHSGGGSPGGGASAGGAAGKGSGRGRP